jgi:hypothetical protein
MRLAKIKQATSLYKCLLMPSTIEFIQYVLDNPGCSQRQVSNQLRIEQSYFSTKFGPLSESGIITIKRKGLWLEYDVDIKKIEKVMKIAKKLSNYKPVDKYARAKTI